MPRLHSEEEYNLGCLESVNILNSSSSFDVLSPPRDEFLPVFSWEVLIDEKGLVEFLECTIDFIPV